MRWIDTAVLFEALVAGIAFAAPPPDPAWPVLAPWEDRVLLWTGQEPVLGIDPPAYGVVEELANGELHYVPVADGELWNVGSDSLVLTTQAAPGVAVHRRITVVTGGPGFAAAAHGFEPSEPPLTQHDPGGQLEVGPEGALFGLWGALLSADGSGADAFFELTMPEERPEPADPGCADVRIDLGTGTGGGQAGGWQLVDCLQPHANRLLCLVGLMSGIDAAQREIVRLEAGLSPSESLVRGVFFSPDGARHETEWIELGDRPHTLRLDWWNGSTGGLRLWRDGRVAGALEGLTGDGVAVELLRIGLLDAPFGGRFSYALDGVRVLVGGAVPGSVEIAGDSFEDGLDAWNAVGTGGGWLEVSPAAALAGGSGLSLGLGDGWGTWILDTRAAAERAVGLRLRIDADPLRLGPDETIALVHGMSADGQTAGDRFAVRLWNSGSGLRLQVRATQDSEDPVSLPYQALSSGAHRLELRWRAAREAGSRDGWLRLWLDGQPAGELIALDNARNGLEAIRLGALNRPAGSSGLLHLDEVEIWRSPAP